MNPLLPKENSILLYISMIVFCACNEIKEQNPLVIDSLSITQQQASNDELNWQDQISLDSSIANGSQELATNVTFPELNQSLADFDSVKVKGETYYIAEGDLLLSRQELIQRLNFENLLGPIEGIEKKDTQKAVVIKDHKTGNIIKWTKFPLSFAIDQHSFSTIPNGYPNVRAAILKAVQDWQSACGVKMIYLEHLDNRPGIQAGSEVDFVVSYLPSDKKETIATSFFLQHQSREELYIFILYIGTLTMTRPAYSDMKLGIFLDSDTKKLLDLELCLPPAKNLQNRDNTA